MAHLRLFGPARDAAGVAAAQVPGTTVDEVAAQARARFGEAFAQVLAISGLWLNGEPAAADAPVSEVDEVAVVPPVSGGC